jgi:DNA-binding transcriptional regulator YiaG
MQPSQVRSLRNRLGWTQSRFAGAMQVTRLTVGRWERGECPVSGPAVVLMRLMDREFFTCTGTSSILQEI